jgi:hypothetical protein
MLTRRRIFVGGVASVICAPPIVRAESLMPIRALIVPMQPVHAGFIERLRFHCMEQLLKNGWTTERARTFGGISENEARRQVTYARMHGLLGVNPPGWRLGFFAAQNSYACASGPSKTPVPPP